MPSEALTLLLAASVAALAIYTMTSSRSGIGSVPHSTETQPQSQNVSELLWPGAFQTAASEPLTAVHFVARGKRYTAEVRSDGFVVASPKTGADVVGVTFAGARAGRVGNLGDPVFKPIRIFSGHAGATSVTTIQRYEKTTYADVYPGIDAIYRVDGSTGDLEFDFAIRPGADPAAIQLVAAAGTRFEREQGSDDIIAANHDVRYRLKRPAAYQWIGGARIDVAVRFVLTANTVRFDVGRYDHAQPLTIDPLVAKYSTFVGANNDAFYDSVNAIATDSAGNVYLAGLTAFDLQFPIETGFPTTAGSLYVPDPRAPGSGCPFQCGYILKLDADHRVVYGALIFRLDIQALAVDTNGGAYATGRTLSSGEFPATAGVFSDDPVGQVFAIKVSPDGSALEYAALFVGVIGRAIAVDAQGNAYVAGEVETPNLPTTTGSLKPAYQPTGDRINTDAFLLKINPVGTALVFGTYLGGTAADTAHGVTLDAGGRALVVGSSSSTDFVGFPGPNAGLNDAFVMQVSADGSGITNGKYLGGSGGEHAAAISSDGQDGYLVAGATESANFPVTAGVIQSRLLGTRNGWLARFDSNLTPRYVTYFGGSFIDGLLAVTADANANAYVVGPTFSADMMTTPDGFQDASSAFTAALLAGAGSRFYPDSHDPVREAFFAVLDADGTRLEYGTYLGGYYTVPRHFEPLTFGTSIARAASGAIYVGGNTLTASFPTTGGGLRDGMGGNADGFLVQFVSQNLAVSSPTLLPEARIETAYNYQLQATGGVAPYRWEVVGFALPDGLLLSSSGQISGTTRNGQTENWGYQFTVRVTDTAGRAANKSLFINVTYPGNPSCTPGQCVMSMFVGQSSILGLPYLSRGVAPLTLFVAGTLPPGITIDLSNGVFSGAPTTAGIYDFSFRVVDAVSAEGTFNWRITVTDPNAPPPAPPPTPTPSPPSSSGGGGGGALVCVELAFMMLLLTFAALRTQRRTQVRALSPIHLSRVYLSRSSSLPRSCLHHPRKPVQNGTKSE